MWGKRITLYCILLYLPLWSQWHNGVRKIEVKSFGQFMWTITFFLLDLKEFIYLLVISKVLLNGTVLGICVCWNHGFILTQLSRNILDFRYRLEIAIILPVIYKWPNWKWGSLPNWGTSTDYWTWSLWRGWTTTVATTPARCQLNSSYSLETVSYTHLTLPTKA